MEQECCADRIYLPGGILRIRALHRREAHHIHNAGGSVRLNAGKSLAPGGTERFHFRPAPAAECRVESTADVKAWNQWRAGHDHGAHREPGGSASATEAHCPDRE